MKLRVVMVDDEPLARDRLRRLLETDSNVEIVGEAGDGKSAVTLIQETQPDLLFLDIQMPGMDGFQVLRALGAQRLPRTVFVTAFDQHAVRAFEERALDYLLKPVAKDRLNESLSRAREQAGTKAVDGLPAALLELLEQGGLGSQRVRQLTVKTGERTLIVKADEIDWVEAAGNYVILHVGKENHIIRDTMSSLEGQLTGDAFLRVSRSGILNLRRVKELQTLSPGEHVAILSTGQRVSITRSIREVEDRLRYLR